MKPQYLYRVNGRFYYIPEFVERFVDNEHWDTSKTHWYQKYLRASDRLVWNRKINRWIVYRKIYEMPWRWREYVGQYTMMLVCHTGISTRQYREPGSWITTILRHGDLSKGGSVGIKEVTKVFDQLLTGLCGAEKEVIRKLTDVYEAMNKDKDMIGRTSILVGQPSDPRVHRKMKRKPIRFIGLRTGKHLGTIDSQGKMHLAKQ